MNGNWTIASSPHIRTEESVPRIMYWVIGTLMLPVGGAIWFFGWDALRIMAISVAAALLTEFFFLKARKKDLNPLRDGSAIVTGLLLALTLPPGLKTSQTVIGAAAAIALGKGIFGGLGYNVFNPALVGRAFLQAAFPVAMTTWETSIKMVDAVSAATPLGGFKFSHQLTGWKPLLLGNVGGCLGETSALLLALGGFILLVRRYIDWRIPAGVLGSVLMLSGVLHALDPNRFAPIEFHLLAGGLMLGAFFMATDMVTSPLTPAGTWIYAIGIGVLVLVIRNFGGLPEGVMYSILVMNGFVPLLNRFTRPRILGERGVGS
jgi:Na+-translocating ferredoxin:NAD+ oxidoreductase subunit D